MDRFDRLIRAVGRDGLEKLQKSVVTVVFDSVAGKYFGLPFAMSGMPVKLVGASQTGEDEKVIDIETSPGARAHAYDSAFNQMTPMQNVAGIEGQLGYGNPALFLENSKVIIDCTTDERSKAVALSYALKNQIPFISTSTIPGYAKMAVWRPGQDPSKHLFMNGMSTLEQKVDASRAALDVTTEIVAAFMSGIAADEAVKAVLGKDETTTAPLYFKLGDNDDMFRPKTIDDELMVLDPEMFREKSALVYGAGAVGANVGYWLARLGFGRVDFLDYDDVERSNVIRTFLYYDRVGFDKAFAAQGKVSFISDQDTKSDAIIEKLTPDWNPSRGYDVYFDGFDNLYSRMLVSHRAIGDFTPLVSASGRSDGFDLEVYVPNTTLCFDCNFGINDLGEKDEAKRRQSCGREFTPQNTWINQSVGALSSMMLANIFLPEQYGAVFNGMVTYDPQQPGRLFVQNKDGVCNHVKGGALEHNVR